MKQHEVLYKKTGENSDTPPSPMGVWADQVDLETTDSFCLTYDDDRLVTCKVYSLHKIWLPDWLSPGEYCARCVEYKWLWGLGGNPEWSEQWQRSLLLLSSPERLACIKLLATKKFRSPFRQSLCEQLKQWLEVDVGERIHKSPFTRGQWEALVDNRIVREADNRSLYRDRSYYGAPWKG